jgi:hypothetical protein
MKLSANQVDVQSLTQVGREAVALIDARDFRTLGERFGYALAYGRNLAEAIESDFVQCISDAPGPSGDAAKFIKVKYFESDDIPLYAVVECITPVGNDAAVLVELIVTGNGEEKHITLEQISYVT